ncbi:MAG: hypothetical protein HYS13_14810 [Planctomycetia bacterium]|nr:hypothetical protein [Planctomycetia bacterium]
MSLRISTLLRCALVALGLAVVVAAPLLADNKAKSKPVAKRSTGKKAAADAPKPDADGCTMLHGIRWHESLEKALAAAKDADGSVKSKPKPVFFLRVLGDLNGFM